MQTFKKHGVWLVLIATLVLVYLVERQGRKSDALVGQQVVEDMMKKPRLREAEVTASDGSLLRQMIVDEPADLFSAILMSPEELLHEEMPRDKVTPNIPYVYAGKMVENGNIVVFLTDGRKNYVVKVGDTLDEAWKVISIDSPELTFQYLPLKKQVVIHIGALL